MSASPCAPTACITEPAPRNRQALKNACVKTWKMPAANAPQPAAANMKPSWLTVEYASTFLISFCTQPIVAASSAVSAPITAITAIVVGATANTGDSRHTRYTPEVTIVAAWISALTGVGPAIASGSHTYSGICALLPVQPRNRNSVAAVATAERAERRLPAEHERLRSSSPACAR